MERSFIFLIASLWMGAVLFVIFAHFAYPKQPHRDYMIYGPGECRVINMANAKFWTRNIKLSVDHCDPNTMPEEQ